MAEGKADSKHSSSMEGVDVPYQPQTHAAGFGLAYADFVPACLDKGGIIKQAQYERFDVLAARANEWLKQNPNVKVASCEGVQTVVKKQPEPDTQTAAMYRSDELANPFHRSLRVWFVPKHGKDPMEPDQIGYYNVVPATLKQGGTFKSPEFEDFNATIEKTNQHFKQEPLQGKIINIVTQDTFFENTDKCVDPDVCYWKESGDLGNLFVMTLRIFYRPGPPAMETIGVVDFVPSRTSHTSKFTKDSFEPLHAAADRAGEWIQQHHLNVTNVQSIDYKVPGRWEGGQVDTMRSLFMEHGTGFTRYLRIIRVYHTYSFNQDPPPYQPLTLSYRSFQPSLIKKPGVFSDPTFELLPKALERAQVWIKLTGAKVICAETVTMQMQQKGVINTEETYTHSGFGWSVACLRVYLDGVYTDPAPDLLPPQPHVK